MGSSFDLHRPERFTTGALGPPGARVFYLQATKDGHTVSLRLEKQQVAALCEYLAGILADLPPPDDGPEPELELLEPVVAEWAVGSLAVAYEQQHDLIVLLAEEQVALADAGDAEVAGDPPGPGAAQDATAPPFDDADDDVPASARFLLSRGQVAAFIERGLSVVAAGRERCLLCGGPMDPEGHRCPRLN